MRHLNGVLALGFSAVLFSCVAMLTLYHRERLTAELLAGDKSDALSKYVHSAEMELEGLEGAMPTGSVARSFPKEEKELRSLFNKGLKQLRSIEKQGDVQTRLGRKGDAAAAARAAKMAASLRGSRGLSSLAARSKRSSPPSQVSAVARQRQLDASYAADSKENRALSGAGDVDALFKSLNNAPAEKKARTTQLSLEASPQRRWGVVYDPAATREHALRGEAKREYDRWSQLAQTVSDVPDPSEDTAAWPGNHRSTAWWKWSRGGDSGKWWEHNHAGRGY